MELFIPDLPQRMAVCVKARMEVWRDRCFTCFLEVCLIPLKTKQKENKKPQSLCNDAITPLLPVMPHKMNSTLPGSPYH